MEITNFYLLIYIYFVIPATIEEIFFEIFITQFTVTVIPFTNCAEERYIFFSYKIVKFFTLTI